MAEPCWSPSAAPTTTTTPARPRAPLCAAVTLDAPQAQASPGAGSSSRPEEVAAFEAFQARHGLTGGWEAEDHAAFLKCLRACRGNLQHVQRVCEELQLGDAEAVAAHIRSVPAPLPTVGNDPRASACRAGPPHRAHRSCRWHQLHNALQDGHRGALEAWRRERAVQAAAGAAVAAAEAAVRGRREQARQAERQRRLEARR